MNFHDFIKTISRFQDFISVIRYAGGCGWWCSAPVCVAEGLLCWLPRHLKENRKRKPTFSQFIHAQLNFHFHCGEADLVTRWLVGLFSKAQADQRQRNRGQQSHRVEEGDGMQRSCHRKIASGSHTRYNNLYRNCGTEGGARTYLIWARRRRAARTCRGWEPRAPGWWPHCGCAGWAWWGRRHSTCCIGRPGVSG